MVDSDFNRKHPRDEDGKFTNKHGGSAAGSRERLENIYDSDKRGVLEKEKKTSIMLENNIDSILAGTYKDSHIILLQETPKILQEIGIPNKPLLMTAKHVYLAINKNGKYSDTNNHYHDLGKKLFLQIPDLLKSPVIVFCSQNNNKDIIAIVNATDKEKNPLIVPIRINGFGRYNEMSINGNIVKSLYGKRNLNRYIEKNVRPEDILLIQNKKIRTLQ